MKTSDPYRDKSGRRGDEKSCYLRRRNLLMAASVLTLLTVGCLFCFCPTEESDAFYYPCHVEFKDESGLVYESNYWRYCSYKTTYREGEIASGGQVTREGYHLSGWYEEGNESHILKPGESFLIGNDITLIAIWTPNNYKVYFPGILTVKDGNGTAIEYGAEVACGTVLTVTAESEGEYAPVIELNGNELTTNTFTVGVHNVLSVGYRVTFGDGLTVNRVTFGDGQIKSGDIITAGTILDVTVEARDGYLAVVYLNGDFKTAGVYLSPVFGGTFSFSVGVHNELTVEYIPIE